MSSDANFKRLKYGLGLVPNTTTLVATPGDIDYDTSSGQFNFYDASGIVNYTSASGTQTFTNKTIPTGSNHITATINRAAQFNSTTGDLEASTVTNTELGYVSGVTSSIQAQLNAIAGSGITALTGDGTATGPGSVAFTLATVNGNVGTFGSSTSIPTFTVNAKGLITAASGNVVIAPAGTLSGTTLNATVVSSSLTSVGTITSGTWNGTTIAINKGGTNATTAAAAYNNLSPMTTTGDMEYESAPGVAARLAIGTANQILKVSGGIPTWATFTALTNPMTSTGDIIYSSDNLGTPARLGIGTSGQILEVTAGIPSWVTASAGEVTGAVKMYAGTSIPSGYYLCDGTAYNRTTDSALFTAIGTAYGNGDGSTTFNVPDFRGLFPRGVSGASGNDPDKGSRTSVNGGNSGNNIGSYQANQNLSHAHNYFGDNTGTGSPYPQAVGQGSSQSFTAATGLSGGNQSNPNNLYINFIIKN